MAVPAEKHSETPRILQILVREADREPTDGPLITHGSHAGERRLHGRATGRRFRREPGGVRTDDRSLEALSFERRPVDLNHRGHDVRVLNAAPEAVK